MNESFWTWMLEVYPRPGVSEALIALQDKEGLNVNALLFCCWLACRSQRLSPKGAQEIEQLNEDWAGAVVAPVRGVRRLLKSSTLFTGERRDELRGRIQALELELEQIHTELMETRAAPDEAEREDEPEERSELANDNARQYFAARKMPPGDQTRVLNSTEWQTIVKAICVD